MGSISLEAYADLYEQLTGTSGLARAVPAKEHPCHKFQDLKQASFGAVTYSELKIAFLKDLKAVHSTGPSAARSAAWW